MNDLLDFSATEEALRQERDLLARATAMSPVSIFVLDRDGQIIFANPRAEQVLGLARNEIIQRAYNAPEWRITDYAGNPFPEEQLPFPQVLRTGQAVHDVRLAIEWPAGRRVLLSINTAPLLDRAGQVDGMVATAEDVTTRVESEVALRESEERFRRMFQHSAAGMVLVDPSFRFLQANSAFCRMLGYAESDLLTKTFQDVTHSDDRAVGNALVRQVLAGEREGFHLEKRYLRQNGTVVWGLVSSTLLRDAQGNPLHFVTQIQDITARKQAEEALQESEKSLREAQHLAHIGSWQWTVATDIVKWSEELYHINGRDPHLAAPGYAEMSSCYTPESWARLSATVAKALQSGEPYELDLDIVRPDATTRHTFARGEVDYDAGGKIVGLHGTVQDITARQRAEEQLQRYAAELQRSNRDLEKFTYVVSHDLQEPLRTISNFAGLLAELGQGRLGDEADECLHFVLDGANRMEEMVQALLDYSRIGTRNLDLAPADCETVLQRTLADLGFVIAERGVTITHDPLPTVTANAAQLGQLFQNLIVNAIKFHRPEEPPRVHIGAERLSFPPAPSPLREAERGGGEGKERGAAWLFSVRDNGIGIAPRYHEEIFHVFRRLHTREEYPGTGIGLAICARIVERHGGRIWVESEPGQGATFYFTLPAPEEGSP